MPATHRTSYRPRAHGLTVSVHAPDSFAESEIHDLYRLKATHLPPRSAHRVDDFKLFVDEVHQASAIVVARSQERTIQGFYLIQKLLIDHSDGQSQVFMGDYWVMNEAYRRTVSFGARGSRYILLQALRQFTLPTYVFCAAFPASYISLRSMSSRVWALRQDSIPSAARHILDQAGKKFCGGKWDSESGLVQARSLPARRPPPARKDSKRAFRDYIGLNPDFLDGIALGVLIPADLKLARDLAGWALNRGGRQALISAFSLFRSVGAGLGPVHSWRAQ